MIHHKVTKKTIAAMFVLFFGILIFAFVKPSDVLELSKNDKDILNLISP